MWKSSMFILKATDNLFLLFQIPKSARELHYEDFFSPPVSYDQQMKDRVGTPNRDKW